MKNHYLRGEQAHVMTTSNPFIEISAVILSGSYRYTYVTNNPLKYTDPSGYLYYRYERIQWEEGVSKSSGGGGGYHFDPWILNNGVPQEGFYVDFTGQAYIDGAPVPWSYAADVLGTTIYEAPRDANGEYLPDSKYHKTILGTDHLGNQEVLYEDATGAMKIVKVPFWEITGSYFNAEYFLSGIAAYGDLNLLKRMMKSKISLSSFVPAAWSWEINGSAEGGVASSLSLIGGVIALRGSDRGKYKSFLSAGLGGGWVSVSAQVLQTNYHYFGDIRNFDLRVFEGGSVDIDATGGEGIVGGVNITFMAGGAPGEFMIGFGRSVGLGAGSPFSGSVTYHRTWFY